MEEIATQPGPVLALAGLLGMLAGAPLARGRWRILAALVGSVVAGAVTHGLLGQPLLSLAAKLIGALLAAIGPAVGAGRSRAPALGDAFGDAAGDGHSGWARF